MNWRPVVIMLVVIASVGLAFNIGVDYGVSKNVSEITQKHNEQMSEIRQQKEKIQAQLNQVDERYTRDMLAMQQKIDEAKKQAAQYEPPQKTSCNCDGIDSEWVRIHNTAANVSSVRGTKATGVDDGEAKATQDNTGASKKQALEVVTDNYATCAVYINQLEALQEYVSSL